ncbi:MAG: hypothetical protein GY906_10410 [bacterium]|nr:hypothetical protein [bacterium]
MTFDTACSRLRLGGSISGSVLSGGTVIDAGGIAISTRSGMYGFSGYKGQNPQLLGSDGQFYRERKPVRAKTLTLNFRAYGRDATGTVTTSVGEHLEANMDDIMELIAGAGEQVILERDMENGDIRWIQIQPLVESQFIEGAFFNQAMGSYDFPVICSAAYPYWQSEELKSKLLDPGGSPDTVVQVGNARISNATYTFPGASILTNTDNGDILEVNAACLVDVGQRQISNGGSPTPGRLEPPNRLHWMWLGAGTTNVTIVTNQCTVSYRDHWH